MGWDGPRGGVTCKADQKPWWQSLVAAGTVGIGGVGAAEPRQGQVLALPSNNRVLLGKRFNLSASLVNDTE